MKEEKEKMEEQRLLSLQNLCATTDQAQDSLKRAKRVEAASWIANSTSHKKVKIHAIV
ncbi:MAG: hypothetical protein WC756_12835 [Taibaiella sp.]